MSQTDVDLCVCLFFSQLLLNNNRNIFIFYLFLTAVSSTPKSATDSADYTTLSATATFQANMGQTTAVVMLTIMEDMNAEGTEFLELSLEVPASAGVVGEVDKAVVNILDNDVPRTFK